MIQFTWLKAETEADIESYATAATTRPDDGKFFVIFFVDLDSSISEHTKADGTTDREQREIRQSKSV